MTKEQRLKALLLRAWQSGYDSFHDTQTRADEKRMLEDFMDDMDEVAYGIVAEIEAAAVERCCNDLNNDTVGDYMDCFDFMEKWAANRRKGAGND